MVLRSSDKGDQWRIRAALPNQLDLRRDAGSILMLQAAHSAGSRTDSALDPVLQMSSARSLAAG
jgi:hypothetical protein